MRSLLKFVRGDTRWTQSEVQALSTPLKLTHALILGILFPILRVPGIIAQFLFGAFLVYGTRLVFNIRVGIPIEVIAKDLKGFLKDSNYLAYIVFIGAFAGTSVLIKRH